MGFVVEFDAENNVLRGTLDGRVTDAILFDCYTVAAGYAASHPQCRGIWNFSDVTEFEASSHAMRQVEERPPIIQAGYMRVIVASQDVPFGMMRMLQILSDKSRPELHVVRTLDEAYRLLLVESPKFSPAS